MNLQHTNESPHQNITEEELNILNKFRPCFENPTSLKEKNIKLSVVKKQAAAELKKINPNWTPKDVGLYFNNLLKKKNKKVQQNTPYVGMPVGGAPNNMMPGRLPAGQPGAPQFPAMVNMAQGGPKKRGRKSKVEKMMVGDDDNIGMAGMNPNVQFSQNQPGKRGNKNAAGNLPQMPPQQQGMQSFYPGMPPQQMNAAPNQMADSGKRKPGRKKKDDNASQQVPHQMGQMNPAQMQGMNMQMNPQNMGMNMQMQGMNRNAGNMQMMNNAAPQGQQQQQAAAAGGKRGRNKKQDNQNQPQQMNQQQVAAGMYQAFPNQMAQPHQAPPSHVQMPQKMQGPAAGNMGMPGQGNMMMNMNMQNQGQGRGMNTQIPSAMNQQMNGQMGGQMNPNMSGQINTQMQGMNPQMGQMNPNMMMNMNMPNQGQTQQKKKGKNAKNQQQQQQFPNQMQGQNPMQGQQQQQFMPYGMGNPVLAQQNQQQQAGSSRKSKQSKKSGQINSQMNQQMPMQMPMGGPNDMMKQGMFNPMMMNSNPMMAGMMMGQPQMTQGSNKKRRSARKKDDEEIDELND